MALTGLTKIQKVGINTATIPTLGGSENVGVVTATNFIGDGSGLSNVIGSGAGVIVRDGGSLVGTAGTINFGTNLNVSAISAGIVTVTNAASATALTNLSDVTVSSASNGQILKHNGSAFVNVADTTYSQSSVASGSNVNLRLSDGSTDDDILITAGSNITFSSVSAGGFTIAASGGGGGGGLSNVVEDTSPELGGNLNLNNKFITGSGGVNVSGVTTSTSFVGALTGNVTGNADTATTATNVTVSANNSTDETVFPLFVDGATGGQGAESDTGFTYNPSSGNLTATKFTGSGVALSGVVTSIVAGSNISLAGGPTGIVTISSSGGGGLSLSNGTNNNVVTASSATALNGESNLTFDGTTLALTGNQTASGSVVVGSGVTIDARGINAVGTALTAGRFQALTGSYIAQIGSTNQGFYLNNSGSTHLGLYWSSSASANYLYGTGNHNLNIQNFAGISILPSVGAASLGYAGSNKLVTDIGGVKITGVATATGFSGPLTGDVTGNADTATTATNVTVTANNSTDETVYPIFVDGATGAQGAESDTGLSYNPSTGALTSGSFVKSGGSSSQFLKADGSVDGSTYLTSGSYLENVVEDTTPQLGGNLDLNSKNITGTGNAQIVGVITATSAVKTWTLGASGSDHYTFVGDGFTSATNDPDIYLERGKRYAFLNNSGGSHPFQIRVASGGSAYATGVTYHTPHDGNNNSASQGYITFNVPWSAPATLVYQCTSHGNMLGNIYIRGGAGANNAVGFTTFSNKIEVQSSSNTAATFIGSGGAGFVAIKDGDDGTQAFLGVDGGAFKVQTSGGSYSDKLTIDSGGTSTFDKGAPGSSNQVIGRFQAESSRALDIVWHDSGSLMGFDTPGNHSYTFKVNGSEKLRISSGGQFKVGTGAIGNTNIKGSSGTGNEGVYLDPGGPSQFAISNASVMALNRKTSEGRVFEVRYNGSVRGYFDTNGSSLPSDKNYKTNISDLSLGLSFVNKLKPSQFRFKDSESTSPILYGLIAQDVEESLTSEGVSQNSTQMLQYKVIADDDNESDYYLDYGKLTPVLINAVKELSTEIETLKTKVAALEGS